MFLFGVKRLRYERVYSFSSERVGWHAFLKSWWRTPDNGNSDSDDKDRGKWITIREKQVLRKLTQRKFLLIGLWDFLEVSAKAVVKILC